MFPAPLVFKNLIPPYGSGGASNAALRRTAQYGNELAVGNFPPPDIPEEKWDIKERLEKLREFCEKFRRKLVLKREPKEPKEVGFNLRIDVNINPNKEKALEEARHYWMKRKDMVYRLKYGAFGDAETVIEKLKQISGVGAYLVTIYPNTSDSKTQWERIEKEVLPNL